MAYGSILGQSFETSPVLDNYFTKDETLTSATAALYGLGTDAVPDDVLEKARELITAAQNTAVNGLAALKTTINWQKIGTASGGFSSGRNNYFTISLSSPISDFSQIIIEISGTVSGNPCSFFLLKSSAGAQATSANLALDSNTNNDYMHFVVPRTVAQTEGVMAVLNTTNWLPIIGLTSVNQLFFNCYAQSQVTYTINVYGMVDKSAL